MEPREREEVNRMIWAGYIARMGGMRHTYGILIGKPTRKRPLGRPRHKCVILKRILDWIEENWNKVQWRVLVDTKIKLRAS
jgi:hypothetical protein